MSFAVAVDRFLSVDLSDDNGDAVTTFAVVPTPRTNKLMANYGIMFRQRENGLSLYYKTNPVVTPPLVSPIVTRVRFSFVILPDGPDPSTIFAGLSGQGGSQFLLDNLDDAGVILPGGSLISGAVVAASEHVSATPNRLPVVVDLTGGIPAHVEAQDRFSNAVIAQTPIEDLAAQPPVAPPTGAIEITKIIDIPKSGEAAVRVQTPAPGTLDRLFYADDEVAARRPIGVIDLYWQGPQDAVPANDGLNYTAVFARQ